MVNFKDMVNQILSTKNFIDERMKMYFYDTYQWTCREQISVFHDTVSTAVAAMETVGIWLAWYSGFNIRQDIQTLHDKYKHLTLIEAKNEIVGEIWRYYGTQRKIAYTEYLDVTYGNPINNIQNVSTKKLEKIGDWLFDYYGINLQYQFNSTGGISKFPVLDEEFSHAQEKNDYSNNHSEPHNKYDNYVEENYVDYRFSDDELADYYGISKDELDDYF